MKNLFHPAAIAGEKVGKLNDLGIAPAVKHLHHLVKPQVAKAAKQRFGAVGQHQNRLAAIILRGLAAQIACRDQIGGDAAGAGGIEVQFLGQKADGGGLGGALALAALNTQNRGEALKLQNFERLPHFRQQFARHIPPGGEAVKDKGGSVKIHHRCGSRFGMAACQQARAQAFMHLQAKGGGTGGWGVFLGHPADVAKPGSPVKNMRFTFTCC